MHKLLTTAFVLLSFFVAPSAFSKDTTCLKVKGDTPNEAFYTAIEALERLDAEMGPKWMHDNMQIRLLEEKVDGKFVAVVYSTVKHQSMCEFEEKEEVAEYPRPECDQVNCTI